ncbi:hypothetical protein [Psychroserpens sp. NJDZ02]|uniref:hypothetical protein n=1 Tax=Psychroserpens sp. NJDZ02 TaxID=2570561 RepID=UPI0010A935A4|nr:hypothetical protein [Psychroserpens sp. NJDZ02]QCE41815.1 hypothetical protein E9099_10475 [Psychroserpens sp. NJDZ02]
MKKALQYLLFILLSTILSVFLFYLYVEDNTFEVFGLFYIAPPAGILTGIIFLLVNHFLLKNHQSKKTFYLIRILLFILIYTIVCSVMLFGGDIIYSLTS